MSGKIGKPRTGFLALHLGAGYHSEEKKHDYGKLCKRVCERARRMIEHGDSAADVVSSVLAHLEDSELTNAGYGSNLTCRGRVECDASIMSSRSQQARGGLSTTFGAVAALSDIRNPILAAKLLLEQQHKCQLQLGLVPPCCLVGDGAHQWAVTNGLRTATLETNAARKRHKRITLQLEQQSSSKTCRSTSNTSCDGNDGNPNMKNDQQQSCSNNDLRLDTIGAVCMDSEGSVCAGSSSGGIHHKYPGRMGHVSMYGCGVWTDWRQQQNGQTTAVATTTSGCGEHIIPAVMSKSCGELLLAHSDDTHEHITRWFQQQFIHGTQLQHIQEKLAGCLAIKCSEEENYNGIECIWIHTTPTMYVAYVDVATGRVVTQLSSTSSYQQAEHVLATNSMPRLTLNGTYIRQQLLKY